MYCVKCGAEIKEGNKFCPACGNPINGDTAQENIKTSGSNMTEENNVNFTGKSIFANYFRDKEVVKGKLYFDEKGITFQSGFLGIQVGNLQIKYSNIVSVTECNSIGKVPNGMLIVTRDGLNHKFVINHRNKVIPYIENMMKLC